MAYSYRLTNNGVGLGYFCAHLQKSTKAKISGKKIPPGLIHQHETKKVVEQNDLAIRESISLKRTKKVDDEDSRKLNTTKQKIKEEILTRPIKIKKGVEVPLCLTLLMYCVL